MAALNWPNLCCWNSGNVQWRVSAVLSAHHSADPADGARNAAHDSHRAALPATRSVVPVLTSLLGLEHRLSFMSGLSLLFLVIALGSFQEFIVRQNDLFWIFAKSDKCFFWLLCWRLFPFCFSTYWFQVLTIASLFHVQPACSRSFRRQRGSNWSLPPTLPPWPLHRCPQC